MAKQGYRIIDSDTHVIEPRVRDVVRSVGDGVTSSDWRLYRIGG